MWFIRNRPANASMESRRYNEYDNDQRICDALRDLVPFVQLKKREKHPQRSVNFSN